MMRSSTVMTRVEVMTVGPHVESVMGSSSDAETEAVNLSCA